MNVKTLLAIADKQIEIARANPRDYTDQNYFWTQFYDGEPLYEFETELANGIQNKEIYENTSLWQLDLPCNYDEAQLFLGVECTDEYDALLEDDEANFTFTKVEYNSVNKIFTFRNLNTDTVEIVKREFPNLTLSKPYKQPYAVSIGYYTAYTAKITLETMLKFIYLYY